MTAGKTSTTHQDLGRAKHEASGINVADAKRLGLVTVANAEKLHASFEALPALKLGYFDLDGQPTSFYRVRYLATLAGFAGAVAKPQRYAQEPDTLNEVYLPPLLKETWREHAAETDTPLLITEGELKAAAACARGFVCLGLGGVDVWRSARRGIGLLPPLDVFKWLSRQVYVVFDSDAATNPNVVRAQLSLAAALSQKGARVNVVSLPAGPGGVKQGLDDYLLHATDREVERLLDASVAHAEAQALFGLNEEVIYVRQPGLIVEKLTGNKYAPGAFVQHVYAHRTYDAQTVTKEGALQLTRKPLAKRWIAWEGRQEALHVTYAPGEPRLTDRQEWNGWRGWGCEPAAGDVRPWSQLLDYMFHGLTEERRWFEQWCAYPLQHPGVKMNSSVLIWGRAQGTGKTLIGYTLMAIYGDGNSQEVRNEHLHGPFNEWAENKQFLLGDEITGSDKRSDADRMKGLITQKKVTINTKFVPAYSVPDRCNWMFTSQHPDAFFVEDTDRRYFIHEAPSEPLEQDWYEDYDSWLKDSGPAALFAHLLTVDLTGFNPRAHALDTAAKRAMIADGKSDVGAWTTHLREEPDRALELLGGAARTADLLSTKQLLALYDPQATTRVTANGLGRELKRAGFHQVNRGTPLATSAGLIRLYAVRNFDSWKRKTTKELVAHWEQHFGVKGKARR